MADPRMAALLEKPGAMLVCGATGDKEYPDHYVIARLESRLLGICLEPIPDALVAGTFEGRKDAVAAWLHGVSRLWLIAAEGGQAVVVWLRVLSRDEVEYRFPERGEVKDDQISPQAVTHLISLARSVFDAWDEAATSQGISNVETVLLMPGLASADA